MVDGFLRPIADVPQRRHFTTAPRRGKDITLNFIRLLFGLRGAFQNDNAALNFKGINHRSRWALTPGIPSTAALSVSMVRRLGHGGGVLAVVKR